MGVFGYIAKDSFNQLKALSKYFSDIKSDQAVNSAFDAQMKERVNDLVAEVSELKRSQNQLNIMMVKVCERLKIGYP